MTDLLLVRGKGGRQAATTAATSTKLAFASSPGKRTGVYVTAYSQPVYLKVTNLSDSDPTPSSTDYDFIVPASATVLFPWTSSIGIWAQTGDKVSAVEVYA